MFETLFSCLLSLSLFSTLYLACPSFSFLFLSHFLLPINIFESKSIRKDITFVLMSIPVTFTRLCKRIPEAKANKKEKNGTNEWETKFCTAISLFFTVGHIDWFWLANALLFASCHRYIFGQISWLDQIKRKLKVKKEYKKMNERKNNKIQILDKLGRLHIAHSLHSNCLKLPKFTCLACYLYQTSSDLEVQNKILAWSSDQNSSPKLNEHQPNASSYVCIECRNFLTDCLFFSLLLNIYFTNFHLKAK